MVIKEKYNVYDFVVCLITIMMIGSFLFECSGQTRKELERKKYQNLREIEYASKLLNETEKSQKISVTRLLVLNSKIISREKVIQNNSLEVE